MKRTFTKLVNNLFGKKQPQTKTMPSSRFFPNSLSDYDDKTTTAVPEDHLRTEIYKMIDNITAHLKPIEINGEDGLYLGTTGVAYMFYHLSKVPTMQDRRSSFLSLAIEYLQPSLQIAQKYANAKGDAPSLILGNCGIYAVATVLYKATGDEERSNYFRNLYYETAEICKEMKFLEFGSDELFVGRAGYLCGALWIAKETATAPLLEDLNEIVKVTIASGSEYSSRNQSASPLMYAYYGVEYFGAAHGLCSILQMLVSVPGYLDSHPQDAEAVKGSVDYLLSLQDAEGNFPSATDDINSPRILVHWCHGAPGVVYLMAKSYLTWHDEKYLQSCEKMADLIWKKGLLKKGPGLCHGVAGSGYVFLLLYRLTNKEKYLHRAIVFSQFLESEEFKKHSRVPDNPFSLYEGIAGTVCFLADITSPNQAAFPLFDVF